LSVNEYSYSIEKKLKAIDFLILGITMKFTGRSIDVTMLV